MRDRESETPSEPPTLGGGGGLDMFRCICRHALYRVHAHVARPLKVTRRPIEWRRTREPELGDVFQPDEGRRRGRERGNL